MDALIAVGGTLAGAVLGYILRGRERRSDRRVAAYSEVAGSFYRATNSAVRLQSLHFTLGDSMRRPEHRETVGPAWNEWADNLWSFKAHYARARIVASKAGGSALAALHDWFEQNVMSAPPFQRDLSQSGDAAQRGPAAVAGEAAKILETFVDSVRADAR